MIANGSTKIEVATLVIAAIAALASILGVIINAVLAKRHNHRIWLRDLRVQIYSQTIESAERFSSALGKYSLSVPDATKGEAARKDFFSEHVDEVTVPADVLANLISDVSTFGSIKVRDAGIEFDKTVAKCLKKVEAHDGCDYRSDEYKAMRIGLDGFRSAVRDSLEVSPE